MASERLSDDERLQELLEVIVATARKDFRRRAFVGDGDSVLDGIATGINMLADEIEHQHELEQTHLRRVQQSERLALLGRLSATLAHEINTPAAYVLANLSADQEHFATLQRWAEAAKAPPPVLAALDELQLSRQANATGVGTIASIVRDLRGFVQRKDPEPTLVPIAAVIDDARRLVTREVGYRAELQVFNVADAFVSGDRARLTQLMTSLLVQAAQSIPEGSPADNSVRVSVELEPTAVIIQVRDTGRGLADDSGDRPFDPLRVGHPDDLDRKLAHSICSEITRQHGGTLTSESVAGKGTTVTLSLPRPAVAKPDIPRTTTPTRASRGPLPRVLLIDDEPLVLSAFARLLRKDCELSSANGGADAVRILKEDSDWDLVICDMMMPGLDGPAVFSFVQTNLPELSSRFAVCTGGAFTERVTAFLESFEGIVLEKPLRKRDVLDVLARTKASERG